MTETKNILPENIEKLIGSLPDSTDFRSSLEFLYSCYPNKVEPINESFDSIQSFIKLPEILKEHIGINSDRAKNCGWMAVSSWVLYEASKFDNQEINKILEASDLPVGKVFGNNPKAQVITHAHKSLEDIINFLSVLENQGEVNFFDSLLKKDARHRSARARTGERVKDEFSRAINSLNTEDAAPDDSNDLLRYLAETFEKNSVDGRKRAKRISDSMNSLINSFRLPEVRDKMNEHPEIKKRADQFVEFAEVLAGVARETSDVADQILQLKNASSKKKTDRQKTWNLAKELIKKSFTNRTNRMGGKKREIDISSVISDLKEIDKILDEARSEVSPQYKTAKNRSNEPMPKPQPSPDVPQRGPVNPNDPVSPESPGPRPTESSSEVKMRDGSDTYTTDQVIQRLGLHDEKELKSLMNNFFGKVVGFVDKGKDRYYSKKDIEKIAGGFNTAKPLDEPKSEAPPITHEPTEPEKVTHEPVVEKPPEPPAPPLHEPDWDDPDSENAQEAINKEITHPSLKRSVDKSGLKLPINFNSWITGEDPSSKNPWALYLALRGSGDRLADSSKITNRVTEIFRKSNENPNNNPWNLLSAYEKLISSGVDPYLQHAPSPQQVGTWLATNLPKAIESFAKSGKLVKSSVFSPPQPTEYAQKVKKWLNKIENPRFRSVAANRIIGLVPGGMGKYLLGWL